MSNLSKNISSIAAVRTQRIVIDFLELHTLLSFAIAFCAGYFFQAKIVYFMTGDMASARIIAAISCIGLTAIAKYFMRSIDDNEKIAPWVHHWIKPAFGLFAIVFVFWIDSKTSNMAIENTHAENIAERISSNAAGSSEVNEWKRSKSYHEERISFYDAKEKETGKNYIKKREYHLAEISKLDAAIAQAEQDEQTRLNQANELLIATVKDSEDGSMKKINYGTFLLLIAFGIEILAVRQRKPSPIYEVEFENLAPLIEAKEPMKLLPATTLTSATATVHTRETEEALIHRKTERTITGEIPVEQIPKPEIEPEMDVIVERKIELPPAKLEPKNWEEACIFFVTGKLELSERKIVEMFPKDVTRYKVRSKLDALRHSPSLLGEDAS